MIIQPSTCTIPLKNLNYLQVKVGWAETCKFPPIPQIGGFCSNHDANVCYCCSFYDFALQCIAIQKKKDKQSPHNIRQESKQGCLPHQSDARSNEPKESQGSFNDTFKN